MTQEIAAAGERVREPSPYAQHWRAYLEAGFSPLPEIANSKRPAIHGWSGYCGKPPAKEEAAQWAATIPGAGIAIALGFNGAIAADFDTDDAGINAAVRSVLPAGAPQKRGQKGSTLFFRFPHGDAPTRIFRGKDGKTIFEILGYGRKTTIPPSIHPLTGKRYEWVSENRLPDMWLNELPELPPDFESQLETVLKPWLEQKPSWDVDERLWEVRPQGDLSGSERKRYEAYALTALKSRAAELADASAGSRNSSLFTTACYLGKWEHHGIIPRGEVARELFASCNANGLLKEDGRPSVLATIRSGIRRAQNDPLPVLQDRPRPGAGPLSEAPKEWTSPQPLVSKVDALPYPVEALPPIVQDAVKEAQARIMAPTELVAACALTAMSTAIQGLVDVERMNGLTGPVSLFALTVAMSGDRKSTVDRLFTAEIRKYEKEQEQLLAPDLERFGSDLQAWECERAGLLDAIKKAARDGVIKKGKTQAELRNELHALEAKKPRKPSVPRLIRGDDTSEALAWSLANEWPSAAIISAEAGIVFGGHAMGPDAIMRNLSLQNVVWDGGEHRVGRRTQTGFTVHNARLTAGLQVQEEPIRAFVEKNGELARGAGYFARFLFSKPRSIQGERLIIGEPPRSQPHIDAFGQTIAKLLRMPLNFDDSGALSPALLTMTPRAKEKWISLYNDIERKLTPDGAFRDIRDVASKAADNIARLAAIFHVFEHGPVESINAGTVSRAGEIIAWHLNEAVRFLGEFSMPAELSAAARLECWAAECCRRSGSNVVPRRDIQRCGPYGLRDGKKLDEALKELRELGRAQEIKNGVRREVHFNPEVLVGGVQ